VLETQVDSLKDEAEPGEQKEEVPHQEINISIADYQVRTEPTPYASISAGTLPPDEKQPKAGPSEHTKDVQEPSLE
jgi:hypothetical protein